jgi:hypothetical protein
MAAHFPGKEFAKGFPTELTLTHASNNTKQPFAANSDPMSSEPQHDVHDVQ